MNYLYSEKKKIYCKDTNEHCTGDKYLYSRHWKQKRKEIYDYYDHKCQRCQTVIPFEQAVIHHRTYKRFGNEKNTDLILYCKSCHTIIHKNKKQWHNDNKSLQYYLKQLTNEEKQRVIFYIRKYILGE